MWYTKKNKDNYKSDLINDGLSILKEKEYKEQKEQERFEKEQKILNSTLYRIECNNLASLYKLLLTYNIDENTRENSRYFHIEIFKDTIKYLYPTIFVRNDWIYNIDWKYKCFHNNIEINIFFDTDELLFKIKTSINLEYYRVKRIDYTILTIEEFNSLNEITEEVNLLNKIKDLKDNGIYIDNIINLKKGKILYYPIEIDKFISKYKDNKIFSKINIITLALSQLIEKDEKYKRNR